MPPKKGAPTAPTGAMALFTLWGVKNGTIGKDITNELISAPDLPALRRLGAAGWARSTSKAPGLRPSAALPCVVMDWGR